MFSTGSQIQKIITAQLEANVTCKCAMCKVLAVCLTDHLASILSNKRNFTA